MTVADSSLRKAHWCPVAPVAGGLRSKRRRHIPSSLEENAVANHHSGAGIWSVITLRDTPFPALAVGYTGKLGHLVGDFHYGIHIKDALDVLADHGQALQPHACVDVLLGKLGVVIVAVVVKLRENIVPDLDIAVAIAAHCAVRPAAAVGPRS